MEGIALTFRGVLYDMESDSNCRIPVSIGKTDEDSEMEIFPQQVESPGDGHYID